MLLGAVNISSLFGEVASLLLIDADILVTKTYDIIMAMNYKMINLSAMASGFSFLLCPMCLRFSFQIGAIEQRLDL